MIQKLYYSYDYIWVRVHERLNIVPTASITTERNVLSIVKPSLLSACIVPFDPRKKTNYIGTKLFYKILNGIRISRVGSYIIL